MFMRVKMYVLQNFRCTYKRSKIKIKNCYPVTTKADKTSDGFGLKSIRSTVDKYHGNVTFDVKKNWFELKILIPHGGAS